jgi:succinate-semialdehyde dehydrogenase / glutarate-semialdehyde dehydrogenase
VVLKPSEETPLTALALCAIAEEAGIPSGVINCLTVGREEVKAVGEALCHSDKIRKLSFTGSTAVGKFLMRESASTVKKVSLELGGNAPFIVFDDADLDVAVKAIMTTKFRNAGQACIASNRILVQENVYEKFADLLCKKVTKMVVGNGLQPGVSLGPLINQKGLEKVSRHVDDSIAKGAQLLTGGPVEVSMNSSGATFYKPTVLTGVTPEMAPFTEETFGPLAALMAFKTEEEAIQIANDTPYGLAAYVCTKDNGRIWRVSEALEFGMIGVNNGTLSAATTPFGGMKESGIGREGGHWGIQEFLEVKYVGIGI